MTENRISTKKKARDWQKYLRAERPDYAFLKSLFQHLRSELEIEVPKLSKKLPKVPTEKELKRYNEVLWKAKNFQDMMILKTLMYTGVRVSELINTKLADIDFITARSESTKERVVRTASSPFPNHSKNCWP